MTITIGSYEAKSQLPKFLRLAEEGNEVNITRRGKIVARIVSAFPDKILQENTSVKAIMEKMKEERKGRTLAPYSLREMIEFGRA